MVPPAPKNILHKIFKSQDEINFRYFRLPIKTIKAWKKDENIDLTKNKSCMLRSFLLIFRFKINEAERSLIRCLNLVRSRMD